MFEERRVFQFTETNFIEKENNLALVLMHKKRSLFGKKKKRKRSLHIEFSDPYLDQEYLDQGSPT